VKPKQEIYLAKIKKAFALIIYTPRNFAIGPQIRLKMDMCRIMAIKPHVNLVCMSYKRCPGLFRKPNTPAAPTMAGSKARKTKGKSAEPSTAQFLKLPEITSAKRESINGF
jgi:hypothetical protein